MRNSLSYIRILLAALLLAAGVTLAVGAFIPFTDDFGQLVILSTTARISFFAIGIALAASAVCVAVPGLLKKSLSQTLWYQW